MHLFVHVFVLICACGKKCTSIILRFKGLRLYEDFAYIKIIYKKSSLNHNYYQHYRTYHTL